MLIGVFDVFYESHNHAWTMEQGCFDEERLGLANLWSGGKW